MSGSQSLTTFAPTEYEVIEATMSESARGRWFLAEFSRRNRTADTDMLLGAMARLESAVGGGREPDGIGHLRGDLMDMANAISRTKAEIAALSTPDQDQTRLGLASEALDAIVRATERATTDILGAAEEVQETAWTLREQGVEASVCDDLDRHATQIYTACSFQDLTAQRTGRIVHTLRYLEERLSAMIGIWGTADDRIPPAPGEAAARTDAAARPEDLCQSDVDRYIAMEGTLAAAPAPTVRTGVVSLEDDIAFVPVAPESDAMDVDAPDLDFDAFQPEAMETAPSQDLMDGTDEPELDLAPPDPEDEPEHGAEAAPTAAVAVTAGHAFEDIDALSIEEKIALFS